MSTTITLTVVAWMGLSALTVVFMYCCSKVSHTGSDENNE